MILPGFVYFLAAFGLAFIIGYAKISLALRTWLATFGAAGEFLVTLLECLACSGFWMGVGFGAYGVIPLGLNRYLTALVVGCATAASNFLIGRFSGLIHLE